jgi:hypothetical protein
MLQKTEMQLASVEETFSLRCGALLRVCDGRGKLIVVREGVVWITQDGDRRDYTLGPGAQFQITRNGLTLIHGCEASVVTLQPPKEREKWRPISVFATRSKGIVPG